MIRSTRLLSSLSLAALAFTCAFAASTSARAQRWERRGPDYDHYGLYFAVGLGGGLQLLNLDDGQFAGQVEVRLGYSFGRRFQVYLDGDFSGSSHQIYDLDGNPAGSQFVTANDVMLGLRYFLYMDPFVGVYARAGLGLGIVSGVPDEFGNFDTTQYGIAESYALGMEFRIGGGWALSPEVFYRRTNETQDYRVDTLGLGLLINFN